MLNVAVAVGFEPTVESPPHTLSSCELRCSGVFGRSLCGLLYRSRTSAHGGEPQGTRLRLRLGLASRPVPRVQATCPESPAGHRIQRVLRALASIVMGKVGSSRVRVLDVDDPEEGLGLPVRMDRKESGPSWYEHALAFMDALWVHSSAKHPRSTADALVRLTCALVPEGKAFRDNDELHVARCPDDQRLSRARHTPR